MEQEDRDRPTTTGSPILGVLGPDERADLLRRARRILLPAGALVFSEGDPGDALFVVAAGRVEVSIIALDGRKSVLDHLGPGESFGEIALLDRAPRSATVIAATDVALDRLDRADVMRLFAEHPRALEGLIAELCRRVRNASARFSTQSQASGRARLATVLITLAAKWGVRGGDGLVRLEAGFSQSDLGAISGLSRENVNRHLGALQKAGVLSLTPDGLVIRDPAALAAAAEPS